MEKSLEKSDETIPIPKSFKSRVNEYDTENSNDDSSLIVKGRGKRKLKHLDETSILTKRTRSLKKK